MYQTIEEAIVDIDWWKMKAEQRADEVALLRKALASFLGRFHNNIVNADLLFGDIAELCQKAIDQTGKP